MWKHCQLSMSLDLHSTYGIRFITWGRWSRFISNGLIGWFPHHIVALQQISNVAWPLWILKPFIFTFCVTKVLLGSSKQGRLIGTKYSTRNISVFLNYSDNLRKFLCCRLVRNRRSLLNLRFHGEVLNHPLLKENVLIFFKFWSL